MAHEIRGLISLATWCAISSRPDNDLGALIARRLDRKAKIKAAQPRPVRVKTVRPKPVKRSKVHPGPLPARPKPSYGYAVPSDQFAGKALRWFKFEYQTRVPHGTYQFQSPAHAIVAAEVARKAYREGILPYTRFTWLSPISFTLTYHEEEAAA